MDLGQFDFPKLILTEYSKWKTRTRKTFVLFAILQVDIMKWKLAKEIVALYGVVNNMSEIQT